MNFWRNGTREKKDHKQLDFGGDPAHDSYPGILKKEFLPLRDGGNRANFVDNSKSCRRIVM